METQSLVERTLTEIDHVRLMRLASVSGTHPSEAVRAVLDNCDLVPSADVPPNVVTMYTQAVLQDDTGAAPQRVTLCYPSDAEPAEGFVSVLSPLGISLLGLRVGDVARWSTPAGALREARVLELLFQPEATGDYTI
jgi:regulator of nucleoside diphosphate kinase